MSDELNELIEQLNVRKINLANLAKEDMTQELIKYADKAELWPYYILPCNVINELCSKWSRVKLPDYVTIHLNINKLYDHFCESNRFSICKDIQVAITKLKVLNNNDQFNIIQIPCILNLNRIMLYYEDDCLFLVIHELVMKYRKHNLLVPFIILNDYYLLFSLYFEHLFY